jgi:hypothetical protein
MVAPLVGLAVGAVARAAAKKAAKEAAKKATKKATEKIAKNSVKVVPKDSIIRARKNSESTINTLISKSGGRAKRDASYVETGKPSKVVKINSAAKAKSADAAKSANAKALKAANKKKKAK